MAAGHWPFDLEALLHDESLAGVIGTVCQVNVATPRRTRQHSILLSVGVRFNAP